MKLVLLILNFLTACIVYAQVSSTTNATIESLITQFPQKQSIAKGEILYLLGQIKNTEGHPINNARIEIWQTDDGGSYDHPDDVETTRRDKSFQFFGKANTDLEGWYVFRTLVPGEYTPRPKHIHFKVKLNNRPVLTSQFYFTNNRKPLEHWDTLKNNQAFQQTLSLQLFEYASTLVARGNIYISTSTLSAKYSPTPSQAEGPYYPVKSFANKDNDLVY